MVRLRRYFFTGLVVLLPIVLTGIIIVTVFNAAEDLVGRHVNNYLFYRFNFYIPGLGILVAALMIMVIGFLSSHFFTKKIMPLLEGILNRIPIIRQVYSPVKRIVQFFFSEREQLFRQVVLVEYPRKGVWALGFITNEGTPQVVEKLRKDIVNVFIPGTPGPVTGYFIYVPKNELVFLDISVEEALKLLVSGGVLNP